MKQVLSSWDDKTKLCEVSYSLLSAFIYNYEALTKIASENYFNHSIVQKSQAEQLQVLVLNTLDELDLLLLETSVNGRLSVFRVLNDYGVVYDQHLMEAISHYLIFPNEESDHRLSSNISSTSSQPLRLRPSISVNNVLMIYERSSSTVKDIKHHLSMLIFFADRHSVIFETFISVRLTTDTQPDTVGMNVWRVSNNPKYTQSNMTVDQFSTLLQKAKLFVENVVTGVATYAELTSNGECDLFKIDVDHELQIFTSYCSKTDIKPDGVRGIKDMLELMQVASFFPVIESVCEQCQLSKCLRDHHFLDLKLIVAKIGNESSLKEVGLSEVTVNMNRVRKILGEKNCQNLNEVFELFEAVHESSAFYQFVKDKGFYKDGGQTYFFSSYELVTAELQHQDYPETVLNHLLGAFKLLSPFMNTDHGFYTLMESVSELDKRKGVKQLFRTVNEGITDIKVWFSNAEVSKSYD